MPTRLLFVAVSLSLASCAGTGPNVFNRTEPLPVEVACLPPLDSLAKLPAYLVPAPAGSTPRQRRQWQKAQAANLARAGVLPTNVKNSSLALGASSVATTITKPSGPVATGASSATDNTKAGQRGGAAATALDAVASTTTERWLSSWWWLALLGALVWWQRKRLWALLA
ncbi:hypothetical protein [Hymenobacter negativus]|uniref:Uncharacterized protein n=1 Tax=Hymenobacter negativus TaxID=2795026 RepID=A0ABS3Q8H6_9BACT|nr:hypothetical protein [Hymenobacter negativus]MBO2007545.1 hypothetical protein [Hymenobacter negativus]